MIEIRSTVTDSRAVLGCRGCARSGGAGTRDPGARAARAAGPEDGGLYQLRSVGEDGVVVVHTSRASDAGARVGLGGLLLWREQCILSEAQNPNGLLVLFLRARRCSDRFFE